MFKTVVKDEIKVPAHIDYLGELRNFVTKTGKKYNFSESVINAFNYLKVDTVVTTAENIEKFDAVILPGVGAFENICKSLKRYKKDILEFLDSNYGANF